MVGKIILLSWPIGALLLALNPVFVAVQNVLTSKDLWLGVFPSLVVAAKLWVLSVSMIMVIPSVMFWSEVKASRHSTTAR